MATETERSSQDQIKTQPPSELDPEALAAIRNLLETESAVAPQPVAERQAEKASRTAAVAPETTRVPTQQRRHDPLTPPEPAPKAKPSPAASIEGGRVARLKASILGYRPTARHLVWASVGLLVVLRPWLAVGLLLLTLFTLTVIFLILGYDGFWQRAMGLARWYAGRQPKRAAVLHRKLDAFAMKWDAILDFFPEGSVDGLYLPDFGDLATAETRHDAALERRFANLSEGEA
ncbi:hypothetical protein OS190_20115 [Sulfitobacter sp. F26204]|uniref:hypothetical protein n=1 Tax=Sulfitobacter sp. F26204 TaxID=2996014 RepID=UPI00225E6EEB|nr:hypothetical protein [Sulfitobacter sp. F26204]MCX7561874.1 hypothetical protein [Sulfitobacter sp. F26204]